MRRLLLLICICLLSLTSCVSHKKMVAKTEATVVTFDKNRFEGFYQNQLDSESVRGLWNILVGSTQFDIDTTAVKPSSQVQLEWQPDGQLKAHLFENSQRVKSIDLEGEVRGNFYATRRKFLLIPIPALAFHKDRKVILGNDPDGNLIITRTYVNGAWVLFMANSGGGTVQYKSERIQK